MIGLRMCKDLFGGRVLVHVYVLIQQDLSEFNANGKSEIVQGDFRNILRNFWR